MRQFLKRELNTGPEGITRYSSFMVVGIDDVLYMSRPKDRRNTALAMRKVLQSTANDLDKKKIEVQIICKGKLVKGDSFWVEYRKGMLPIDFISDTFGRDFSDANPHAWERHSLVIVSIDTIKKPQRLEKMMTGPDWDLIVFKDKD